MAKMFRMYTKHFRKKGSESNLCITFTAFVLVSLANQIAAPGNFELEILEISNSNSHILTGYCCGVPLEIRSTKTTGCPPCSTAFRLCLKEYQSSLPAEDGASIFTGCSFGNATTTILGGSSFVLNDPSMGAIVLPFTFRWTKSFTLILQAMDMYNISYPESERLIEETLFSGVILPSPEWKTLDHIGKNARITYRVRVLCADTYYNTTCTTFCRPRNDQFGHYTCGSEGQKICLNGWKGDNCEEAICKPGCDPTHGKCDHPGECECRPGWHGPLCDECMVYPGCKHGSCNGSAWKCVCDTNWGGILCDQDLNYCGTHEPCMHGGTCENTAPDQYRCTCAEGLSGGRCEIVEHPCATQPCKNGGTCTLKDSAIPNITARKPYRLMQGMSSAMGKPVSRQNSMLGLAGLTSTLPTVTPIHGTVPVAGTGVGVGAVASAAEAMQNKSGNSKTLANMKSQIDSNVDSGGGDGGGGSSSNNNNNNNVQTSTMVLKQLQNEQLHIHQYYSPPLPSLPEFVCGCSPGWSGPTCEINIDECVGDPCQHGGTCIDLIGGFRCECPPEWTGDVCQKDVNECEATYDPIITEKASMTLPTDISLLTPYPPTTIMMGPCINAHKCINEPGSYSCVCLKGWGGPTCAKNLDDCVGQCKNGATCIDLVDDFHCVCATGYTDRYCETDIDECAHMPCRNGGECVDMIGKFKCICPLGYSGSLCEEAKDHCTPTPCMQGHCLNTPGSYYCHCPPDRTGKHCEHIKPLCTHPFCNNGCISNATNVNMSPCSGHGSCEVADVGTFCKCKPGYTGTYCEHNLNECSPNPCQNGGICLDGDGDFTCECISGWTGKVCSERFSLCSDQCQNGGSCIPGSTEKGIQPYCLCPPGWSGTYCSDSLDQCHGQPCHNGGTCESGVGWFRCLCAQGFSGPDCRININECSPQPCQGGATCIDGIGGYTCICPIGRHGPRCEILLSDPKSACTNATTTISPYQALNQSTDWMELVLSGRTDEYCNACICEEDTSRCTNLWCGLPNCFLTDGAQKSSNVSNLSSVCKAHEVCVPMLNDACFSPPCTVRGDCRTLEPSRRVAPPRFPTNSNCWPNQAILNENCARLSILVDLQRLIAGSSVEGLCSVMRFLLASRMVKLPTRQDDDNMLIIICDIRTGTNDTIEVTVSYTKSQNTELAIVIELLGDLLSSRHLNNFQQLDKLRSIKFAPLVSILEVKVETAFVAKSETNNWLTGILCGLFGVLCGFAIFITLIWRQRLTLRTTSGSHLAQSTDVMRHEEEKSNNLQNEENLRRFTNPLKGSSTSLAVSSGMELSLNPAPELTAVSTMASSSCSAVHRSQPLYPPCESNFDRENIVFHKTQNSDMKKNTVASIDSPQKNFGKRAINCKSVPSQALTEDFDALTVIV